MLIKANELVQAKIDRIKAESEKTKESQEALRMQNANLRNSENIMISYLRGDIKTVYKDIEDYVQDKMKLLCDIIEEVADNNISYATKAEKIDTKAGNKIRRNALR